MLLIECQPLTGAKNIVRWEWNYNSIYSPVPLIFYDSYVCLYVVLLTLESGNFDDITYFKVNGDLEKKPTSIKSHTKGGSNLKGLKGL